MDNSIIDVLHINSYVYNRTFYKSLFNDQIKKGLNVRVFASIRKGSYGTAKTIGDYVDVSQDFHLIERFFFYTKQRKSLKSAERIYDFSKVKFVHAHSLFTNGYVAYRIFKKYGVPYVVMVRNGDLNVFMKYAFYLRRTIMNVLLNAKAIVFLSEPYKKLFIDKYVKKSLKKTIVDKSHVIPNGVNEFWAKHEFLEKKVIHKPLHLLYAGEITRNKNIGSVLEAVNGLNKSGFDVEYSVVGKVLDKRIQKQIEHNRYAKYLGFLGKEDLMKIYRENDIFIMPSFTESFGLVYVEAMTQGLPVIYSKGQGFDAQFPEGTVGYHVESSNVNDIANVIKMIAEKFESISGNCVEASRKFSWNDISNEFIALYKENNI